MSYCESCQTSFGVAVGTPCPRCRRLVVADDLAPIAGPRARTEAARIADALETIARAARLWLVLTMLGIVFGAVAFAIWIAALLR